MSGAGEAQGSQQQQLPISVPSWQWPTSAGDGQKSSTGSPSSSASTETAVDQQAEIINRSLVATMLVGTVPPLISLSVAFGLDLSNEQQLAIPAAVTAVTAAVVAVITSRRNPGS